LDKKIFENGEVKNLPVANFSPSRIHLGVILINFYTWINTINIMSTPVTIQVQGSTSAPNFLTSIISRKA
jgi:hypothetical protein